MVNTQHCFELDMVHAVEGSQAKEQAQLVFGSLFQGSWSVHMGSDPKSFGEVNPWVLINPQKALDGGKKVQAATRDMGRRMDLPKAKHARTFQRPIYWAKMDSGLLNLHMTLPKNPFSNHPELCHLHALSMFLERHGWSNTCVNKGAETDLADPEHTIHTSKQIGSLPSRYAFLVAWWELMFFLSLGSLPHLDECSPNSQLAGLGAPALGAWAQPRALGRN